MWVFFFNVNSIVIKRNGVEYCRFYFFSTCVEIQGNIVQSLDHEKITFILTFDKVFIFGQLCSWTMTVTISPVTSSSQ